MKWAKIEDSNASKYKMKSGKIQEETLAARAGNHHLLFLLIQPCSHRNVSNVSDTSLKQCSAGLPIKTFPAPFLGLLGPQPELHPTHFIQEMLLLYS